MYESRINCFYFVERGKLSLKMDYKLFSWTVANRSHTYSDEILPDETLRYPSGFTNKKTVNRSCYV